MNTLKNLESRKVNSDDTSLNCSKSTDVDLAACVNVIEILSLTDWGLNFNPLNASVAFV